MHLCDLSSDASNPAQSLVVKYTKVAIQNKVFPKCEKSVLKAVNVKAKSMDGIRPYIKLHIFVTWILEVYCRDSFARLELKLGSCA